MIRRDLTAAYEPMGWLVAIAALLALCVGCGAGPESHELAAATDSGGTTDSHSDAMDGPSGTDSAAHSDGGGSGDASSGNGGDGAVEASTESGIEGGPAGAITIAAGGDHSCALLPGGTVECWGLNSNGQLGGGTLTGPETCSSSACSTTPAAVPGLSGVLAVAAGMTHSCALLSGGTVECWGSNAFGELGSGTSTGPQTCAGSACSASPVAVSGLSGASAIATGNEHSCALVSGAVECWGANFFGELGTGSSTGPETCSGGACSTTPVTVSGLSGVTAIAAGGEDTCALLSGGAVKCWGWNPYGQLGDGSSTGPETCGGNACSTIPVAVTAVSGASAIAVNGGSACAVISSAVECWGFNAYGELGTGSSTGPATCGTYACSRTPVAVPGLSSVTAIVQGEQHVCALLSGGTVDCWGFNQDGELGDGSSSGPATCGGSACSTTPAAVPSLNGVISLAAGGFGSCAVLASGAVDCWGANLYGQLGNGTSTGPQTCTDSFAFACSTTPVSVSGL